MKAIGAIGVILAASVMVPGCGGLTSDYCDEVCSCEDCSDIRFDECVIQVDASQEVSSVYGCEEPYEQLRQCEIERYTCVAGEFRVMVDGNHPCATEEGDWNRCIDDGSGIR